MAPHVNLANPSPLTGRWRPAFSAFRLSQDHAEALRINAELSALCRVPATKAEDDARWEERARILNEVDSAECGHCGRVAVFEEAVNDPGWVIESETRDVGTVDEREIALIVCPDCSK
jgi:hypothetical protein